MLPHNDTEMSPSQIAYARARNKPCTILYPFLAVPFFFHNTPAHIPVSHGGAPRAPERAFWAQGPTFDIVRAPGGSI